MTRLGVAQGQLSDSLVAQRAVIPRALRVFGEVEVLPVEAGMAALESLAPDIVYHAARGAREREQLAANLEAGRTPFTGCSAAAHAHAASREHMKEALGARLIPSAAFTVVRDVSHLEPLTRRGFPLVVFRATDVFEATDCVVVESVAELNREIENRLAASSEAVFVERYLPGAVFACTVLGNGADRVVLPPVSLATEVDPGESTRVSHVPEGLREGVERVVLETCRALDLRDFARVDLALSERGVPHVISVDAIPDPTGGATNPVLLAAEGTGLDQVELIQRVLHAAAKRSGVALPSSPMFDDLRYRTPPRGLRIRARHA
ncbi:MAG: hypothetical protein IT361_02165 [Gemmatimonadaceae bacterium]|nr:hypothetical protein [Gemmatimonadaceae bacterium]